MRLTLSNFFAFTTAFFVATLEEKGGRNDEYMVVREIDR